MQQTSSMAITKNMQGHYNCVAMTDRTTIAATGPTDSTLLIQFHSSSIAFVKERLKF
jgi:hypothetical protein